MFQHARAVFPGRIESLRRLEDSVAFEIITSQAPLQLELVGLALMETIQCAVVVVVRHL